MSRKVSVGVIAPSISKVNTCTNSSDTVIELPAAILLTCLKGQAYYSTHKNDKLCQLHKNDVAFMDLRKP